MKRIVFTLAATAAVLASCSQPKPKTDFDLTLNMEEVMGHVVDPGAWAFWRASGEIVTEKGVRSLTPTTEEGWHAAESGAATVAESANLLTIPGRAMLDRDWAGYVKALRKAAMDGRQAAIDKNPDRMFSTGAELYQTCVSCHEKYVIPVAIAANREVIDKARLSDFPEDVKARIAAYNKAHLAQ